MKTSPTGEWFASHEFKGLKWLSEKDTPLASCCSTLTINKSLRFIDRDSFNIAAFSGVSSPGVVCGNTIAGQMYRRKNNPPTIRHEIIGESVKSLEYAQAIFSIFFTVVTWGSITRSVVWKALSCFETNNSQKSLDNEGTVLIRRHYRFKHTTYSLL